MPFDSSFFLYIYAGLIVFLLILGGIFWFFRKRYGNLLFLTKGEIQLSSNHWVRVLKVLPFMGEGYLIFVEIGTPKGNRFEVWGYSKGGGFVKISTIGEEFYGGRFDDTTGHPRG
jgi:hypothetical protein